MPEKTNKSDATPQDAGADQVQAAFDQAEAKGYFGTSPDPTPREAYSVAGQLSAQPVPEPARSLEAGDAPSADAAPKA